VDPTWLFFILCPYMLVYFYLCDFTNWAHWKVALFWTAGLVAILLLWGGVSYLYPSQGPFPAPFF